MQRKFTFVAYMPIISRIDAVDPLFAAACAAALREAAQWTATLAPTLLVAAQEREIAEFSSRYHVLTAVCALRWFAGYRNLRSRHGSSQTMATVARGTGIAAASGLRLHLLRSRAHRHPC